MSRIALLAPAYWPEVRRGGERLAHDLGAGARRARARASGCSRATRGLTTRAVEDGIEVVRHLRPPDGRLVRRGYEDHLTHVPLDAARRCAAADDDVVHALHHADAQAAIRSGRPAVWTFLGVPHRTGLANRRLRLDLVRRGGRAQRRRRSRSARRPRASSAAGSASTRRSSTPASTSPRSRPAASAPRRSPSCARPRSSAPHKRAELLRRRVRDRAPRAAGRAAGRPARRPARRRARRRARDLDDHDALVAAYREAHVTALASRGEAFGLVLVESLACGTPAVACGDAAGPEVLGDAGATFSGDDPQALADALLDAALDPGARCRARAERFSLERCVAAHEDCTRSLLN